MIFSKICFSENFSIKFWTSLKNELHGKNQFPGLENNFSWFSVDFRPKNPCNRWFFGLFLPHEANLWSRNKKIYPRESLQFFFWVKPSSILTNATNGAWITNLEKKFFLPGKKESRFVICTSHVFFRWSCIAWNEGILICRKLKLFFSSVAIQKPFVSGNMGRFRTTLTKIWSDSFW